MSFLNKVIFKYIVANTLESLIKLYPVIRKLGDLKVTEHVPNTGSIRSSLENYHILPGIRDVQMSQFGDYKNAFYAADDWKRCDSLTDEIKENKYIDPLIVVIDNKGPYILEGAHRFVALAKLGMKSLPALIVVDLDAVDLEDLEAEITASEYRMSHQAPGRDSGAPLHDLKGVYPEDFYSPQGARYYGDGQPYDQESWRILVGLKGKPNAKVRIYRAVPYEPSTDERIEEIEKALKYHLKYGKMPKEFQGKSYDQIADLRDEFKKGPKKDASFPDINPGDWVSINKTYARDHGMHSLKGKFKICSKLVKASDVFTDGNSIHEQGYDPK